MMEYLQEREWEVSSSKELSSQILFYNQEKTSKLLLEEAELLLIK